MRWVIWSARGRPRFPLSLRLFSWAAAVVEVAEEAVAGVLVLVTLANGVEAAVLPNGEDEGEYLELHNSEVGVPQLSADAEAEADDGGDDSVVAMVLPNAESGVEG